MLRSSYGWPKKKSNSAAKVRGKNPRANSYDSHSLRRPQGSPNDFQIFQGGRDSDLGGRIQIPAQGFFYFRSRDVGVVTPAASLTKITMQGCEQGCRQVWPRPEQKIFTFCSANCFCSHTKFFSLHLHHSPHDHPSLLALLLETTHSCFLASQDQQQALKSFLWQISSRNWVATRHRLHCSYGACNAADALI